MKKLLLTFALAILPTLAGAFPAIVFDTLPGGAGGTLTYDGAGGPAIGTGIVFVDLAGVGTPANDGVVLDCVTCVLSFTTGANLVEGPPLYTWAGGGTISLIGDVPALGLDDAVLFTGTFTGTANTPGLAAGADSGFFLGIGLDTKDPTLAAFYGLSPENWTFANTEIALLTLTVNPDTGAFSAIPNQADLVNTQVPEPATLWLLASGGIGLAAIGRRARR